MAKYRRDGTDTRMFVKSSKLQQDIIYSKLIKKSKLIEKKKTYCKRLAEIRYKLRSTAQKIYQLDNDLDKLTRKYLIGGKNG